MSHRILHEMKLAALPRHAGKDGLPGGFEPGMVVTDDEFHAVHATSDKTFEELPPVGLGFGELHATAEDAAFAVGTDPDGREQGTGHDRPAMADFFVTGVEDEIGDLADWPVPPGAELFVEFGRRPAPPGSR